MTAQGTQPPPIEAGTEGEPATGATGADPGAEPGTSAPEPQAAPRDDSPRESEPAPASTPADGAEPSAE